MIRANLHWNAGRTIHFHLSDHVPDPDAVLKVAAEVLMMQSEEASIVELLGQALGPRGLDVEVRYGPTHADPVANKIDVWITRRLCAPTPNAARWSHGGEGRCETATFGSLPSALRRTAVRTPGEADGPWVPRQEDQQGTRTGPRRARARVGLGLDQMDLGAMRPPP